MSVPFTTLITAYLRQTNCRNLKAAIILQKRRETCKRNLEIRRLELERTRNKKQGCQHPYFGFQARERAAAQREANLAATAAATEFYHDPRTEMTSSELRAELETRTGQSRFGLMYSMGI